MIFSVTTEKGHHLIPADYHVINEGGDVVFIMKSEPIEVNGVKIPSMGYVVASLAQGHWREVIAI